MSTPAPSNQLIQTKRDIRALIGSDTTKAELAKVLPKHLTPDRMARVVLTAIMKTPALMDCTQESLLQCMMLCSQAGLEPDGRLAHLIPYGKVATVIFDFKGIVALALRNGMEAVFADKVCEADDFEAAVHNGRKNIRHVVNYKKARGEAYAYYTVCQREGVIDFEVMTREEVDLIRSRSKAGRSGPWVTDYDEMAKKTVIRRMSKRWDLLPEIRDVINADDDVPAEIKAPMMKPVFDVSPLAPAGEAEPEEVEKAAASQAGNPGAQAAQPSGDAAMPTNYVKAVRNLCKMSVIHEGMLLDFLTATGSTDGSVATLEELAMYQGGSVIKMVHDQWGGDDGLANKIKPKKGGAA
jgi:recombination protein RecT